MSEQIYRYNLDNLNEVSIYDRDQYYADQVAAFEFDGKTTHAVEVVNIFLFNDDGELLIQKRGASKNHNPGLLDKSLGGHLKFGDKPDFSVMVETVEELYVPSIVLHDSFDFEKTRVLLKDYNDNIAIIKPLDTQMHIIDKVISGKKMPIGNKIHMYIGVYNGTTKPSDKEAAGVLYYSLDQLESEIESSPDIFTDDLKFYMERYKKELYDFAKHIA